MLEVGVKVKEDFIEEVITSQVQKDKKEIKMLRSGKRYFR